METRSEIAPLRALLLEATEALEMLIEDPELLDDEAFMARVFDCVGDARTLRERVA